MDKNYLITKSNYFIMNSSYDLSIEEQKIILTLASMVQPNDEEFKPYKFRIAEFMKLLGVEDKSKYTAIPKITKELMKKVFEIQEGETLIQTAWLSGVKYKKGSGMVELIFSPYLKPYMLKLNTMFTQYKLANILNMKSKYSPRVYELLKCNEFKKQGYIEIEVAELRKLLKTEHIYPLYNDFKRHVIERSQKELKKLSDIFFEFEEIKTGRKVTTIKFLIYSKSEKVKAPKEIQQQINTDDVVATSEEDSYSKVLDVMNKHDIKLLDAKKIYDAAKGDLELIKSRYTYLLSQNVDNVVAYMLAILDEGFSEPIPNKKTNKFFNFEQTKYDFDKIENINLQKRVEKLKKTQSEAKILGISVDEYLKNQSTQNNI